MNIEWAPIVIGTLFYTALQGIDTGYGCTLAAIGSVVYVWGNHSQRCYAKPN